jgi:hypothetical protein
MFNSHPTLNVETTTLVSLFHSVPFPMTTVGTVPLRTAAVLGDLITDTA